ncbi:MAG: hypothetical protein ACREAK_06570 [Nitrosarchaeum sp.]
MKDASVVKTTNKEIPTTTKAMLQLELAELKNKTIEEKRLKLALDLRKF